MQDNIIEIKKSKKNNDVINIKIIHGNDVFKDKTNTRIRSAKTKIVHMLQSYFRNLYGDWGSLKIIVDIADTKYVSVKITRTKNKIDTFNQIVFKINDKRYKEDSMVDLEEAYKTMHNNCGIEVGDEVNIVRAAESKEMGWDEVWVSEKDRYVGRTGIIEKDDGKHGFMVRVDCDKLPLHYPFFVLEITKKTKKKKEKRITKTGKIEFPKLTCNRCGASLDSHFSTEKNKLFIAPCPLCDRNSYLKGKEEGKQEVGNAVKRSLGF